MRRSRKLHKKSLKIVAKSLEKSSPLLGLIFYGFWMNLGGQVEDKIH